MAITNIADQKTPARPIEITFAPELGLPSADQEVLLIGHAASGIASSSINTVININNSSDREAALAECVTKGFGSASELTKMVLAAIDANAGSSSFPALKVCPLASTETGFGTADAALTAVSRVKAEFVVSPYDGQDSALGIKLKNTCLLMSGATRTDNNQFGTVGVLANLDETDPSLLYQYDTQYLMPIYMRDTGTNPYSVAELAAASAAKVAALTVPFNPLDDVTIVGVTPPANPADNLTRGGGLETEAALNKGWTPLFVKPNGEVAFVRTVTARLSADGTGAPVVGAYYDVQDFMVLYFFRKTIWTRVSQPDFKRRKASQESAIDLKSEIVRLAALFEEQSMFQAVDKLAKQIIVERSASDRHRFDVKIPVNVVPGLHVIATNIEAGVLFDSFSI